MSRARVREPFQSDWFCPNPMEIRTVTFDISSILSRVIFIFGYIAKQRSVRPNPRARFKMTSIIGYEYRAWKHVEKDEARARVSFVTRPKLKP